MNAFSPKRIWFWIAVAAVALAMVVLLLPHHGGTVDHLTWLAVLPVFFVGLLAPLTVGPLLAVLTVGHAPEEPALAPSLQRPPPAHLA